MRIGTDALRFMLLATALAVPLALNAAVAAEEKCLRPEVQQMVQSVGEKLQAAADKLGLTEEQQAKIREIDAGQAEQRTALRTQRRSLLQDELKALAAVLTPEQRAKVKDYAEDKVEQERPTPGGLPRFAAARDTLAERAQCAGEKLGLTGEQRQAIVEALSSHAGQHAELRAKCKERVESEFKAIAAVLTPEQRPKAREQIEQRVVIAAAARSVADRLDALAEKIGLSDEQREQIKKTHAEYDDQYDALRSQRLELMQEELKALSAILTPEQREKVRDFCEDRIVLVEVAETGASREEAMKALRETITERLEALADKLELSTTQREEIRKAHASFAEKFKAQREQRTAIRREELKAMGTVLTPEQREKARDFAEESVAGLDPPIRR